MSSVMTTGLNKPPLRALNIGIYGSYLKLHISNQRARLDHGALQ